MSRRIAYAATQDASLKTPMDSVRKVASPITAAYLQVDLILDVFMGSPRHND
jgi:hypothetical protein